MRTNQKIQLKAKIPSSEASQAICKAAKDLCSVHHDPNEELKAAEDSIKNLTGHDHVKIVNSGNSAILSVMSTLKGAILIPDQGGWSGFEKMASFLGLETKELGTNLGIIEPEILVEELDNNRAEALFLTSFAAYTAEQPIKEIYKVCEEEDVLLVEDASGSLGDPTKKLAWGKQAHVILASTGSPKMVNAGSGGFFSTNRADLVSDSKKIHKTLRASPLTCASIKVEIKSAAQSFSKTVDACKFLKNELNTAFHRDKRGVNVCLATEDPKKFAYQLRTHIEVVGGGMITICPRYERLMQPALCLEIKNLDLRCLSREKLEGMVEVVNGINMSYFK
ncbi:MAG: DegT/DnrJ/EryC1/StrS family aminotransferase [Methanobacteriaceae archaeon]|nr:DegT/DnrJ/EryC1/StrS family aminotransferase [Methanobacteriaceae archaeon]